MCLLSSQNLDAIRNALWYLGSGVVGSLRLYHGSCNSAYIIIKATANKQALKLCLYLALITNNRTNCGKEIIFVFQERNYSVVSESDNVQGLRKNCLHSTECFKIFSEKQNLILLLSFQEAISN